jgi:hypothetical protein
LRSAGDDRIFRRLLEVVAAILEEVNPDDLRAYARRDWRGAERSKREHWAREIALRGPLATFEASQVLWDHMRRLRPDWPSPEERRADLAHHIALKHALDLAAGAFRSTANR